MSNRKIVLLGAGWLGKAFAESLAKKEFDVYAGTRKIQQEHVENQCTYFPLRFDKTWNFELSPSIIQQADWLILMLPPTHFENYAEALLNAVSQFPSSTKVLITSSTSVYADVDGMVDENGMLLQEHVVTQAENSLRKEISSRLTIVRLAGLIGPNRHPAKYLLQKGIIVNGNAPVNLTRREDVVQACLQIIQNDVTYKIFNICSPQHPTRADYYGNATRNLFGEELPADGIGSGKTVDGSRIERELHFNYQFKIDEWDVFR